MGLGARIGNAVANNEEQVSKSQKPRKSPSAGLTSNLWICPTSLSFTAEQDGTCKLEQWQNLLQQRRYITFSGIFRSGTQSFCVIFYCFCLYSGIWCFCLLGYILFKFCVRNTRICLYSTTTFSPSTAPLTLALAASI